MAVIFKKYALTVQNCKIGIKIGINGLVRCRHFSGPRFNTIFEDLLCLILLPQDLLGHILLLQRVDLFCCSRTTL